MSEERFQSQARFSAFLKSLRLQNIRESRLLLYFPLSLVTFYIFSYSGFYPDPIGVISFIALLFLWPVLTETISKKFDPPAEMIIGMLFVVYSVDATLLRYVFGTDEQGFFIGVLKQFHLISQMLMFLGIGLFIVNNRSEKKGGLVFYALIAWLAGEFVQSGGVFSVLIMKLILFVFLLRRTAWLERLTKVECWLYLIAIVLIFRGVHNWDPFLLETSRSFGESQIWFAMPWVVFKTFKYYLFALLIKIPIVLIYNFASLSRKLKISSLFQSTFPQFIQAITLIILFYFFMAGWQGEKVRQALFETIDRMVAGEATPPEYWFRLDDTSVDRVELPGYQSFKLSGEVPLQGVLVLAKKESNNQGSLQRDYFIFTTQLSDEEEYESLHFVRMDTSFLQQVAFNTSILAGSRLLAYPYVPSKWENYLFSLTSRIGIYASSRNFHIFPFGMTQQRERALIATSFDTKAAGNSRFEDYLNQSFFEDVPTMGRVLTHVLDHELKRVGFFTFDIVMIADFNIFTNNLLSYALLLSLIYLLVNFALTKRMVKFGEEINTTIVHRFNQLRNGIKQISSGNLDYRVKIEGRDEFVELGDGFNQMGDRLKASISEAREKERLAHELAIARQVQLDLLPQALPTVPGFDIDAMLETANEVGGDFYDVIPLDEKRFLFTIGDVSGKGTSAAFYMAQFISLLRFSPEFTDKPDEIAFRLNRYFSDPKVDKQVFVTAIIGILDTGRSTLHFVRAGHVSPILVPASNDNEIKEIKTAGLGIGIERGGDQFQKTLQVAKLKLRKSDSVVFCTDGLEEAARQDNDLDKHVFYGTERLYLKLSEVRGKSSKEAVNVLRDDLKKFYGAAPSVDDCTVLIIRKE